MHTTNDIICNFFPNKMKWRKMVRTFDTLRASLSHIVILNIKYGGKKIEFCQSTLMGDLLYNFKKI